MLFGFISISIILVNKSVAGRPEVARVPQTLPISFLEGVVQFQFEKSHRPLAKRARYYILYICQKTRYYYKYLDKMNRLICQFHLLTKQTI